MSRPAAPIILSSDEGAVIQRWARSRSLPPRQVLRARIIQLAAAGVENQDIANRLRVSRPTVQLWRQRFLARRLPGLEQDLPRAGRLPRISDQRVRAIVDATLHSAPTNATRWSTRSMAEAQGVSEATVRRIWRQHQLTPHVQPSTSEVATVTRLRTQVVGLYLNPPQRVFAVSVDDKELDTHGRALQPPTETQGRHAGVITNNSVLVRKRRETDAEQLAGALERLDDCVRGDHMPDRRHQELIRFLKRIDSRTAAGLGLHVSVEDDAAYGHPKVTTWLRRHPRFHLHPRPTFKSWLALVQTWVRPLVEHHRRAETPRGVSELIAAINSHLSPADQKPHVFVWWAPGARLTRARRPRSA